MPGTKPESALDSFGMAVGRGRPMGGLGWRIDPMDMRLMPAIHGQLMNLFINYLHMNLTIGRKPHILQATHIR